MFPSTKAKCLWSRTRWDHAAAWAERNPAPGQGQPTKPDQTEFVVCESTIFVRFSRWSKSGVWDRLFATMADEPDFEYVMIDSTIVRAHQHAAGKKGGVRLVRSDAHAAG